MICAFGCRLQREEKRRALPRRRGEPDAATIVDRPMLSVEDSDEDFYSLCQAPEGRRIRGMTMVDLTPIFLR